MASCEVCGNEYDRTMQIIVGGERHVFDSFECAIHAIAPRWSTVSAASSATAPSPAMPCTAARTARTSPGSPQRAIGSEG